MALSEQEQNFYIEQCNALGSRLLQLQEQLRRSQKEARQHRIVAALVREGYHLLTSPNSELLGIDERFLRIVMDTMGVDCGMLLAYRPSERCFVVEHAIGLPGSRPLQFAVSHLPGTFHFASSAHPPDSVLEPLREATGIPALLWAFEPDAQVAICLGNLSEDQHTHAPFTENERHVVEGVLSAYIEIRQRKQIEDALRESERRYQTLFESAPDAYYILNLRGTIVDVNKAAQELTDHTKQELVGQNPLQIGLLLEEQTRVADPLSGKAPNGLAGPNELTLYRKDDSAIQVEMTTFPVEINRQTLVLGIARDITRRKQVEAELEQHRAHLENLVEQRTSELVASSKRLEVSLLEKEILLKEVHHRVKNNLQIISSLLMLQAGAIPDDQVSRILMDSQSRVRSMALVHEHLYHSETLAELNFAEYARDLANSLWRSYSPGTACVHLEVQAEDIALNIDTTIPCGLIINELVSNALKHAFADGRAGEVLIDIHRDSCNRVTVMVCDNGIGFPKDWDLRTTNTLGMQLVHRLTQQLNGTINFYQNNGTTAVLTFEIQQ